MRRAGAAMENDQRRWIAGVVRTQVAVMRNHVSATLFVAEIEPNRAPSHFLRYGAHPANLHRATESGPPWREFRLSQPAAWCCLKANSGVTDLQLTPKR